MFSSKTHYADKCYGFSEAQLRFEGHPKIHNLFVNMFGEQNHTVGNATSFC